MFKKNLMGCCISLFVILVPVFVLLFGSCAEDKTFTKKDGTEFTAEPYGWANSHKKVPGVVYEVNMGNILWSALFVETVAVPVVFTGWELFEPVDYVEPEK